MKIVMQEMKDTKPIRYMENIQQNNRIKSFLISDYFKGKSIKLSNQKTNIGRMDKKKT